MKFTKRYKAKYDLYGSQWRLNTRMLKIQTNILPLSAKVLLESPTHQPHVSAQYNQIT